MMTQVAGVEIHATAGGAADVLTAEALAFLADLERRFGADRRELLAARAERQRRLDTGELPDFLAETRAVRAGDWRVGPIPDALANRRVEITGPTDRKMVINALNSGASVFMADFEDANAPTWRNMLEGQVNLTDAIDRTIELASPDGRIYRLDQSVATLMVRPRGWHLVEKHLTVDGQPISASLFDVGLYLHRNARRLLDRGAVPAFYLPKLEGHREAHLWNEVFCASQAALGLPRGTIKATVLIETILAAFEMDEILFELREHAAGLNAGRWDYIFSAIKKLRNLGAAYVLPDRAQITMTVPFMRAYTELLVQTCHRRGAYAIGGMAAFIPSRRDPAVNEQAMARVREDKMREAGDGFDGTWVAHPDLVPIAKETFDATLGDRPHQLDRRRADVAVTAGQLIDLHVPGGKITEAGLRNNINVGIRYIEAWLGGTGAVAIANLMEDAATAEIARSQVWQWVHNAVRLRDGTTVTADLVRRLAEEELAGIRQAVGEAAFAAGRFAEASGLFARVALDDSFIEFLTLPAYDLLD